VLLPAGLLGLMLTGMLAALASTVDSHLNWGASYWANDLYRGLVAERWLGREPSQRSLVRVARVANAALLAAAFAIMTQLDTVQSAWKASLVLGAGIGPPMILRWLWWRMNGWGELASLAVSAVVAPAAILGPEGEAFRMTVVASLSTASCVAVSLATSPEDRDHLVRFYERVQPPGWWGPVARAAGRDPRSPLRALGLGLARTTAAAVSLFACLVGLLWPVLGGSAWGALLGVTLAALAAPVWVPALRRERRESDT